MRRRQDDDIDETSEMREGTSKSVYMAWFTNLAQEFLRAGVSGSDKLNLHSTIVALGSGLGVDFAHPRRDKIIRDMLPMAYSPCCTEDANRC